MSHKGFVNVDFGSFSIQPMEQAFLGWINLSAVLKGFCNLRFTSVSQKS
jgi:hypothetical protein